MSYRIACAAVASSALMATAAQATPRCEQPRQPADRIACAKAAEGANALRRFVTRTQGIYQLYYWDYAPMGPAVARQDESPVGAAAVATAARTAR